MIDVILYSRENCHLCEQARTDLEALKKEIPFKLKILDVDQDEKLKTAYDQILPLVEIGPYRLKAPFSRDELRVTLGAARDRLDHIERVGQSPQLDAVWHSKKWTKADSFSYWFSRHWLGVFNVFVLFYFGLPILAPVMMKAGLDAPAGVIYRGYSFVCHQLAFRSFFLFGEQSAYPRAAAGVPGILTFQQATGMSEASTINALYAARAFVGNPQIGYKIALCERDIAIYGAILLFGLFFWATRRRLPPLPWYLWILIGIVPIGLDGFSQLLSQPPLSLFPLRESTPTLRALTGFLFGFCTAWFGYPLVEQTMVETQQIMSEKWLRLQKQPAEAVSAD
ncbi:MAG: DUF2085 domain-containing protein [Anaerolineales bacterium]|jgi:uncharacterized membrane protein